MPKNSVTYLQVAEACQSLLAEQCDALLETMAGRAR